MNDNPVLSVDIDPHNNDNCSTLPSCIESKRIVVITRILNKKNSNRFQRNPYFEKNTNQEKEGGWERAR